MDRYLSGFVASSVTALWWPILPSRTWLIILVLVLLVLMLKKQRIVAGCLSGVLWMASVGHSVSYWQLPESAFNRPVVITGTVNSTILPTKRQKFHLNLDSVNDTNFKFFKPKVRLSWFHPSFELQKGDRVTLEVKLKRAYGLANQFGFDYQRWLFSQNLSATGYVKHSELHHVHSRGADFRQRMLLRMAQDESPSIRWVMAMSLGYRALFSSADWDVLKSTGTSHLFAISGMHLGTVALLSYYFSAAFVTLLLVFLPCKDINNINIRNIALLISLVASIGFSYLAGFSLPTCRALVLQGVLTGLVIARISWSAVRVMLVTLFIILLLFPLSIWQQSFWLSFGAVVCLMIISWRVGFTRDITLQGWLKQLIKLQVLLSILMAPLVWFQFGGASLLSPIINIVAVPLVMLIVLPLSLITLLLMMLDLNIWQDLLWLTGSLFTHVEQMLIWSNSITTGWVVLPHIEPLGFVWLGLSIAILISPIMLVPKWTATVFLLPLATQLTKQSSSENWTVNVFDVGQGLAVAIEHQNQVWLIDTGARYPSGFSMAEAVLLPFLEGKGYAYVNHMIVSHDDNDHIGGLSVLSENIAIARVSFAGRQCLAGKTHRWGALDVAYLWPESVVTKAGNDDSCVIKISDGNNSVLLPGDIEHQTEKALLEAHQNQLKSTVMVAPHHGSKTSSSESFVSAVAPELVVFSQGYANHWRFPAQEVQDVYARQGVNMLKTSEQGQITIQLSLRDGYQIIRHRQDRHRRWYLPSRTE